MTIEQLSVKVLSQLDLKTVIANDCNDLKCEWNIKGICTCPGLLPCIDLDDFFKR